jgi:hypothetical protein
MGNTCRKKSNQWKESGNAVLGFFGGVLGFLTDLTWPIFGPKGPGDGPVDGPPQGPPAAPP